MYGTLEPVQNTLSLSLRPSTPTTPTILYEDVLHSPCTELSIIHEPFVNDLTLRPFSLHHYLYPTFPFSRNMSVLSGIYTILLHRLRSGITVLPVFLTFCTEGRDSEKLKVSK